MALVAQQIPKVGLVMESARLVRWLKKVGDSITQGEPLLELETEKTVITLSPPRAGVWFKCCSRQNRRHVSEIESPG